MTNETRRITLVARHPGGPGRVWDESNPKIRLIFVDALSFLRYAIDRGINELGEDVERVIIDRTGTALQYLDVLAHLPAEFVGDALLVTSDGNGFLSSSGRGGDRTLYALTPRDIEFYLRVNGLIWSTEFEPVLAESLVNQTVSFLKVASKVANS
jgi:hypothetical protein